MEIVTTMDSFDHWVNNCLKLKKRRTTELVDSKNKPNQIKGKEKTIEINQMANLMEEE